MPLLWRVRITASSASSRAACWMRGGDYRSRALQHDDDGHGYRPTSISKMIRILIQYITYLVI